MALKIDDLKIKGALPELPRSMPLLAVRIPTFEERRWSIETVGRRLGLGKLRLAEVPHGYIFGNPKGEVEFFRASGAIWASDTTADEKFKNEARPWRNIRETGRGRNKSFIFDRDQSAKLRDSSIEFLKESGLLRDEATRPTIKLDQWAHLDEKGKEIKRGAGTATVKLGYKVEGIAAIGPGAKTILFAEPEDGIARISGMFHVWREITGARELKMQPVESALKVGLLQDPELISYHKRGNRIEIDRISFGYLALPAFVQQSHLFPAFEVEVVVHDRKDKSQYFKFGKYYHAAGPKQYAKAEVVASYLLRTL
jgi:hypothetical protein